jgi:hypothetical protein
MKYQLIITMVLFALTSCKKDDCQTCTKTIGVSTFDVMNLLSPKP